MYNIESFCVENDFDEDNKVYNIQIELELNGIDNNKIKSLSRRVKEFQDKLVYTLKEPSSSLIHNNPDGAFGFDHVFYIEKEPTINDEDSEKPNKEDYYLMYHSISLSETYETDDELEDLNANDFDSDELEELAERFIKKREGQYEIVMNFGFADENVLYKPKTLKGIERFCKKYLDVNLLDFDKYRNYRKNVIPTFDSNECLKKLEEIINSNITNSGNAEPTKKTSMQVDSLISDLFTRS